MISRKNSPITRRMVLRGLGASMALPLLESMRPAAVALAGDAAEGASAAAAAAQPRRMAFFYVPNGVDMATWRPTAEGADFEFPFILEPLKPFKDKLLVLSGLAQDHAFAHGDGPGDHARGLACFLTGVHAKKTDGADIRVGVSVDQLAARKVGSATRFSSLELGIERGAQSGNCDSGYSCAYSSNIAWSSPSTPVAKEINPKAVFDRLFSDGRDGNTLRQQQYAGSILDLVREDARRLNGRLGLADRRKLDEYMGSIRELEQRIAHAGKPVEAPEGSARPDGIPEDVRDHIKLMGDLLVMAFQTDSTRIATLMLANAGSNRSYNEIGISDGHHDLSHHGKEPEKIEKISKINRLHIEQFAYVLGKLRSIEEGEGTLLDNVMIVYGSGISDGNRHNHNDLPVLLAGGGGGTIKTGRHLIYKDRTPLNNLFLCMLDRMGAPTDSFGDSTGKLDRLDG